jgi:hypothetical protein
MSHNQPTYLHQNEPLVRVLPAAQADNFSRAMAINLWGCLLLVSLGLGVHSLPMLLCGLAYGRTWYFGIETPDAKQQRFYLATYLLLILTPVLIGFHAIR